MSKIVVTKVKEYVKNNHNLAVSSDFFSDLEKKLELIIDDASKRCSSNDRKTLMARDL